MLEETKNETTNQRKIKPNESERNEPFSTLNSQFSIRTDGYGREILVESEDPNGKPMIWFQEDSKGVMRRYERKGFSVICEIVASGMSKNGNKSPPE